MKQDSQSATVRMALIIAARTAVDTGTVPLVRFVFGFLRNGALDARDSVGTATMTALKPPEILVPKSLRPARTQCLRPTKASKSEGSFGAVAVRLLRLALAATRT